nr:MAG TPA: hypothetical protein [Caudoviricetes sp.]
MTGYRGRRIGGGLRAARPTHIGGMPQQARRKFFLFLALLHGEGQQGGQRSGDGRTQVRTIRRVTAWSL